MIAVRCQLLLAPFEAGEWNNNDRWEWPPSWMRLFSAMVSVAQSPVDDELLRFLENSPPPDLVASEALGFRREAYVPLNSTGATKSGVLPARTNGERSWARAIPRDRDIWFLWSDLALTDVQQTALTEMCRRIPYFGRSTSPAIVEVAEPPDDSRGLRWTATANDPEIVASAQVRCPFPGSLDALRGAHEAKYERGEPGYPWEIGLGVDYGYERRTRATPAHESLYRQLVCFSIDSTQLDGRFAVRVSHYFRRAVMSQSEVDIPSIHGHHEGDITQCAFLGLVDVGGSYSDGHLLGVGVAVPELHRDELQALASVLTRDTFQLNAGPLGQIRLSRVGPSSPRWVPRGLKAERWAGPSRLWATALPIVLDGHSRNQTGLKQQVARAVKNAGLPQPAEIDVGRQAFVQGAPRLLPTDTLRRRGDPVIPFTHARLRFDEQISGPVFAGSMRFYGGGLCIPLDPP
ncbi:MAG: type I-G CRISPR-associated protein Csb2 [Acidimicrobiia bacterium]